MRKDLERGNSMDGFIVIVGILILLFFFILPDKGPSPERNLQTLGSRSSNSSDSSGSTRSSSSTENEPTTNSAYSHSISLSRGNAASEYQPPEEYIKISNRSRDLVDITGWLLKNAKDQRISSRDQNGPYTADVAAIPRGVAYIGSNVLQNIILKNGEGAIVVTGSARQRSPYTITSFKENICSGYLESQDRYTFTPPLDKNCPSPEDEPGVTGLDIECRDFIKGMRSCRVPEFETRNRDGDICRNCVDGVRLSSSCIAFIKDHYNYAGCLANHRNDEDFQGSTWRIYLGRPWEMWAKDYETIYLMDQFGKLVDYVSY